MRCIRCGTRAIATKRSRQGHVLCKECFCLEIEEDVHQTIIDSHIFSPGDVVAIGVSGGKDSTVLMHLMVTLNEKHNYGIRIVLLSADEGIAGYRDESLECVFENARRYHLPVTVVSYKQLFGWTMNEIHAAIGSRNNCTYCGVLRRKALDIGAVQVGATKLALGHNADDYAETVLMNVCRGDVGRLERGADISTGGPESGTIARVKPMKYISQKEVVLYAHYKKLLYFSTPCTYAEGAYRGHLREFLSKLQVVLPSAVADIIYSGERLKLRDEVKRDQAKQGKCSRCGYIASQSLCQACTLLDSLRSRLPPPCTPEGPGPAPTSSLPSAVSCTPALPASSSSSCAPAAQPSPIDTASSISPAPPPTGGTRVSLLPSSLPLTDLPPS